MVRAKDPEQRKFYNSTQWKKLRAIVRYREPFCRICKENPSTNVDHIDGDWRNNGFDNLRALCTGCEKAHTGRQHQSKQDGGDGVAK